VLRCARWGAVGGVDLEKGLDCLGVAVVVRSRGVFATAAPARPW